MKNLVWRQKLLAAAENDLELQQALYTACSKSVLFFINAFVFTYRVFIIDKNGVTRQAGPNETHVPFVTWDVQDRHVLKIENAINTGYDLLTDKARDMGATWDHISVVHHQWLFKGNRTFLEISRKEDCVDTLGKSGEAGSDPGTLFGKHDYINKWLPDWLKPLMERKRMHILNLSNQSRIDGESANATAGSSDRRTAVLLDEMAKMENGEDIKRSTRDVTACRLANSTPWGPGTAYSKWCLSGQIEVFNLKYWDHPEKGLGRYVKQNEDTNKWEIRSPWFDVEDLIRTPKEMAQEVLADHIGSGETFFESHNIEVHRQLFVRPHRSTWTIDFRNGIPEIDIPVILLKSQHTRIVARRNGSWKLWVNLVNGRPDQTKTYIFGIDISKGQGASNSTVSVLCLETREKVAEYANANVPPYEFARLVCAAALWFGGQGKKNRRPLFIWEANGSPGWDFGRQVVKIYQYPFYYIDRVVGVVSNKRGKRYGWNSSAEKKSEVLGLLRRAYAFGGFINHSEEALNETLTYIHYDGGGIGPATYIKESADARKCHGDRVIADMLALLGAGELRPMKTKKSRTPHNSIGGRLKLYQRRRKTTIQSARRRTTFDFRKGNIYAT